MTRVVFTEGLWNQLVSAILGNDREIAGVAFGNCVSHEGSLRILICDVELATTKDYVEQHAYGASLTPNFVARAVQRAKRRAQALIFLHSHPFSDDPEFSQVDDAGERHLREFTERRQLNTPAIGLVIGRTGAKARELGTNSPVEVQAVGRRIHNFRSNQPNDRHAGTRAWDRQVRAFGEAAQRALAALRVSVVGAGGTGSLICEWLAHLGVSSFLIVDPDFLESTNLNRVVGAAPTDVGRAKVEIAKEHILRIRPDARVSTFIESALVQSTVRRLRGSDAIFICTDSHGSRAVLNQFAYQYLIPSFDVGVVIAAEEGVTTHAYGRTQMLSPNVACLTCSRTLDPEQVRRDLLTEFERQRDPYIIGEQLPQPAILSLNATATSLAVTMFLGAFASMPIQPRHQLYDALLGRVRAVEAPSVYECPVCSPQGALAAGDSWPLPGRPDAST